MARAVRSGTRADTALLAVCGAAAFIACVLPPRLRDPLAGGLRRSIVAPLVTLQKNAELSRTALLSHDAAMRVRDSVALRAQQVSALEAENERLRKLIGLGQQLRWGFVPAEALHGRELGDEYTLTLTAGSRSGVRAFSPVVAPEGLVGMVQTVDPSLSLAIIWPHPDFRVSAMAVDGSAFGIVAAHLGSASERFLLEMRGVPFRSTLKPGTAIVSSGLGGVYPKGIPIGTVLGELKTSEGWARTYLVRPAVAPPDVSSVMILQPRRVDAGVERVWAIADTSAAGASSDSLTKRGAAGEAVARRPAGDTAGRAARRTAAAASPTRPAAAGASAPTPAAGAVGPPPAPAPPAGSSTSGSPPAETPRADSARRDTVVGTRPLR